MEDLRPLPLEKRTWHWHTFASMWTGLSMQPAMYSFGGSLIALGLSPVESLIITAVGGVLVATAVVVNSVPGAKFGVPFPVFARASFGVEGAKIAGLSRGLVGVMWLSFQLWVCAEAAVLGLDRAAPSTGHPAVIWAPYLNVMQFAALLVVAVLCCCCIFAGVKNFDKLLYVAAPFSLLFFFFLAAWVSLPSLSGIDLSDLLSLRGDDDGEHTERARFAWIVGLNAFVSCWSTVMMNAADFSRLAPRQREQVVGQFLGIPLPALIVVAIGILGSAAVQLKTGTQSWMLADVFKFWPSWAAFLGGIIVFFLTLTVNIAANIIPPANDFMNLCPTYFRWRFCAYGTIVLSLLVCPFYLFDSPTGFAVKFLGGYGMVTGALYGILVSDFYCLRGCHLDLTDLYASKSTEGAFQYFHGHNWRAIVATFFGIALPFPEWVSDFLGVSELPTFFVFCGGASWFVAAIVSAATYLFFSMLFPSPKCVHGGQYYLDKVGDASTATDSEAWSSGKDAASSEESSGDQVS